MGGRLGGPGSGAQEVEQGPGLLSQARPHLICGVVLASASRPGGARRARGNHWPTHSPAVRAHQYTLRTIGWALGVWFQDIEDRCLTA